jgi:hypothetical protein
MIGRKGARLLFHCVLERGHPPPCVFGGPTRGMRKRSRP